MRVALVIAMSDHDTPFDAIQEDPDICNNCFRRTHDRMERNYRLDVYFNEDEGEWDVTPVKISGIETEMLDEDGEKVTIGGMPPEITRRPPDTDRIPERGGVRQMRTICECGFRYGPESELGYDWKYRPLPKRVFFEYAENLADRMDERDVAYDRDTFFETLDDLKSNPDEQFADDRILRKASKQASVVETVRT